MYLTVIFHIRLNLNTLFGVMEHIVQYNSTNTFYLSNVCTLYSIAGRIIYIIIAICTNNLCKTVVLNVFQETLLCSIAFSNG